MGVKNEAYVRRFGFMSRTTVRIDSAFRIPVPAAVKEVLDVRHPQDNSQFIGFVAQCPALHIPMVRLFPGPIFIEHLDRLEEDKQYMLILAQIELPFDKEYRIRLHHPEIQKALGLRTTASKCEAETLMVAGVGDLVQVYNNAMYEAASSGNRDSAANLASSVPTRIYKLPETTSAE